MNEHSRKMKYLAVAISYEHEGFACSRIFESIEEAFIQKSMKEEFGLDFDEFLLFAAGEDIDVVKTWRVEAFDDGQDS